MRVHRNLHNAKRGGPQWVVTERGKVVEYLVSVALVDVTTRIQPGGAAKCRTSGVRSVVAFFDGTHADNQALIAAVKDEGGQRITYDPRSDSEFYSYALLGSLPKRWNTADAVILNADGTSYAYNPRWQE